MNLALLISSIVAATIQNAPGISSLLKQVALDIQSSVSAIVHSGATTKLDPNTILLALAAVVAGLKADKNMPQETLGLVLALDNAVSAALAEDTIAQKSVDPTALQPIPVLP